MGPWKGTVEKPERALPSGVQETSERASCVLRANQQRCWRETLLVGQRTCSPKAWLVPVTTFWQEWLLGEMSD